MKRQHQKSEAVINGMQSRKAFVSHRSCWRVPMYVPVLVVAAVLSGVGPASASAESLCTDTWVGPVEGDWQVAGNWSTGKVPTSADVACIGSGKVARVFEGAQQAGVVQGAGELFITGGSLEVANAMEPSVLATYRQTNGTLTGAGALRVSSSFTWEGGTMSGSGSTVVLTGVSGTVNFSTLLVGRSLVNEGTLTLVSSTAGKIGMSEGAQIRNTGTFKANSESGPPEIKLEAGTASIVNTGTFEKAEGGGLTEVGVSIENTGTVLSQSGKLVFSNGGSSSGGAWSASAGAIVDLHLGSFSLNEGSLSGEVNITGASVTEKSVAASGASVELLGSGTLTAEAGSITIKNFTMNSTLTGPGTVYVSGNLSWMGGKMTGSGKTVVQSGASGVINSETSLVNRTFVNEGTMTLTVTPAGKITLSEGAVFKNTGTFNANSVSGPPEVRQGTGAASIINTGLFEKTEGGGVTEVEPSFENLGTVQQSSGTLRFLHAITPSGETLLGSLNPSALVALKALCGDPVDCVTGNLTETQTDLSVGGRGAGLGLTRTYNALAAAKASSPGAFGYGWTSSFSDHLLLESANHKATLYQANGSTVPFTEAGGTFTGPTWSADTLAGGTEAGYTVTLADQVKYVFNGGNGRLESVEDRNGNKTTLSYNEKGQLAEVTDSAGRKLKLAYNTEGLVESATDPMGHLVKYTYEGGSLASVTLPGETSPNWRFKYDASHRLTLMIDGRGGETTNTYDGSSRVLTQKDPLGHTLKFEYETFQTKITNEATGAVTLDQFASTGQITAVTHGYGTSNATTTRMAYNEANEPVSVEDGNGHTTTYEYDSAGNKIKMLDPEGRETKWTYNSTHDITSMTRPNGEQTTIELDTHGNPTLLTRPAPGSTTQETHFEYNTHGQATSMTNPLGRKWTYEYNNQGDRTSETDPEGDKRTWAYNEDSQETSTVSPRGNVTGGEPSKYTTSIERDPQGRPVKITDPLGHITRFSYDANGNRTTVIDPNGRETKTEYNAGNEPVKVTLPNGTTRETGYDGAGQITSQTDGNKHTTSYKRNVLEQITEITDPLLHKTTKAYDAVDSLLSITDPANRTTSFTYNKDNQPTKITYSDGVTPTVEYEYDKDGNRTSMIDGSGKTIYTYDQLDRLTKVVDGHGNTVSYEYDLANEQTKITYPNGKTVERTYDKVDRLASVKDWLGNTTSFGYDPNSNLTTTTFPSGTIEIDHYAFNEADQQTEAKMSKGTETLGSLVYTRDNNGQVTRTVSKGLPGAETTETGYDLNERLSKAGSTVYEYDAANNPIKLGTTTNTFNADNQLTEGGSVKYTYDEEGERTKTTPTSGAATTYAYDQAGDLTSVTRPKEGKTAEIKDSYGYNGDGLRVSQTIAGTTTYDTLDHTTPTPMVLSDGTNSYIYGPGGMQIEQIIAEKPLFMHVDQQGSTRMLTGTTGKVEATMTYEAYGKLSSSTGTSTTPIGYTGQYTNSDNGLIYMRARSYDPNTAQFMSIDPLSAETHTPYNYANDDPINLYDPTGLFSIGDVVKGAEEGVEEGVQFVENHPVAAGIGLGIIAVATGGASVVVEGTVATVGLGATSAVAGAGATTLDAKACVSGDAAACVGAGLGSTSVLLGVPESLAAGGLIEDTGAFRALAGAGLVVGGYATLSDLLSNDPEFLATVLEC